MPKKKSPILQKQPIAVEIKAHDGTSSPHVLDLRMESIQSARPVSLSEKHSTAPPSLEEKIAAFDSHIKGVPDLLKTRAELISKLWQEKRTDWEKGAGTLFERAAALGSQMRTQLKTQCARGRKANPALHATRYMLHPQTLPSAWHPSPIILAALLVLITLPIQALLLYRTIESTKSTALNTLQTGNAHLRLFRTAANSGDLNGLQEALTGGIKDLATLRIALDRLGPFVYLLPEKIRFAHKMLGVAEGAASGLNEILENADTFAQGRGTLSTVLKSVDRELTALNGRLRFLLEDVSTQKSTAPLFSQLKTAEDITLILREISGMQATRRVLLVFQNPRELRATGGFAGSFALMTVKDGAIESIESPEGGTYSIQGQLPLQRIAPGPLRLINPRFEFQDLNWWPDFPTSARKLTEFYNAAGGPTVDFVVAITANVGKQILELSGPLKTPDGHTIEAQNFIDALQETIAIDRKTNRATPKKIITTLLPSMLETTRALALENPKSLLSALASSMATKDIQLWSAQETTQAAIHRLNWSGALKNANAGDYLAVISSNIGSGKTDNVVREEINHTARISKDGRITTTLKIRHTHTGIKGNPRSGERHTAYLRIYTPPGASFISASGFTPPPTHLFEEPDNTLTPDPDVRKTEGDRTLDTQSKTEIWQEQEKTVFGNYLIVDPGQTKEATLTYTTTLAVQKSVIPYTLTIDSQAGTARTLSTQLLLDEGTFVVSADPSFGNWHASGWHYNGILTRPVTTSGVISRL